MLQWTQSGTQSKASADERRARVLVVDDHEPSRMFADRVLRLAGYETVVATDGPEALGLAAERGPFDLLLADVMMPGMRGDELARRLRGRDVDLKVLYFTGYSDRLFGQRPALWEGEAFVEKPVTVNGLLEAVSLILYGHTHHMIRGPFADMTQRRRVRVATAPLQVRVGEAAGLLVNLSATGALVRVAEALAPETEWPTSIHAESEPVDLRSRVVRAHLLSPSLPVPTWRPPEYSVALAFTDLPQKAEAVLKVLCGRSFAEHE